MKKPTTQPDLWQYQIKRLENKIENLKYEAATYAFNIDLLPYGVQIGDIIEVTYKGEIVRCLVTICWGYKPWIELKEVDENGKRITKPNRSLSDATLLYDAVQIIANGTADGSRHEGQN